MALEFKTLITNENTTANRIIKLNEYFQSGGFNNQKTKLEKIKDIKDPRTVLPHIGTRYDCLLVKNQNPVRILVLGREALEERGYTIAARSEQILSGGGVSYKNRNPHMQGTTILLKYILKDICGIEFDKNTDNEETEKINHCHIFNYFALANWHLHGCFVGNTPKYSNAIMTEIAGINFIEIAKILEPTVVILQGSTIWFNDAMNKYNKNKDVKYEWDFKKVNDDKYLVFSPKAGNKFSFPVIRFVHPTQRNKNRWIDKDDDYFDKTIKPVLKKVM